MTPALLVAVDGVSEHRGDHAEGLVRRLIRETFTREISQSCNYIEWAHTPVPSPRRGIQPSPRGYKEKAKQLAKLADATTLYGAVLLADNDHHYDDAAARKPTRLRELQEGADDAQVRHRTAIGVAVEMLESWLLADQDLLDQPLPAGKRCEELWGNKRDPASNYPKHVFTRCVTTRRDWSIYEAIQAWDPERARKHSASLDAFLHELGYLAESQGCL